MSFKNISMTIKNIERNATFILFHPFKIYICIYICVCVCIYIYIYIYCVYFTANDIVTCINPIGAYVGDIL